MQTFLIWTGIIFWILAILFLIFMLVSGIFYFIKVREMTPEQKKREHHADMRSKGLNDD